MRLQMIADILAPSRVEGRQLATARVLAEIEFVRRAQMAQRTSE